LNASGEEKKPMKIALTTDDGQTISSHFGQARFFRVITTEDGQPVLSEQRDKAWHVHGQPHTSGPAGAAAVHPGQAMFETISDCQVLITGGIGEPAFARAQTMGIIVFLTGEKEIEKALQSYLNGLITSDLRRIHKNTG
jgi:predicted Fe-Mo cluster-binding NifX family protein